MAKETMYIANLAFFLNYSDGTTNDEIESEIFKVAFQSKEEVHYDRSMGAGFPDLEQDSSNIATGVLFGANLVASIYLVNAEKNFSPYIIVGSDDITIHDEVQQEQDRAYIVDVEYMLADDMYEKGVVKI